MAKNTVDVSDMDKDSLKDAINSQPQDNEIYALTGEVDDETPDTESDADGDLIPADDIRKKQSDSTDLALKPYIAKCNKAIQDASDEGLTKVNVDVSPLPMTGVYAIVKMLNDKGYSAESGRGLAAGPEVIEISWS